MASSSNVWLLLDDPNINVTGGVKNASTTYYVGGTMAVLGGPENNPQVGNITVEFQGTSISFFGNTASTKDSATSFFVSIDSQEPYNQSVPDPGIEGHYTQFYQSPALADGLHTIILSDIAVGLDYALVTAGNSTPLGSSTTIIVDDDDTSEIFYSGNWERNTDITSLNHGFLNGPPLGNTTHQSDSVGDSFEFRFSGTSVTVYGTFLWTASGEMELNFDLDGQITTKSLSVQPGSAPSIDEQPNFVMFESLSLIAGNHTLLANTTNALGQQKFILDYISYNPSFDTIASKPVFSTPSVDSNTSSLSSSSPSPIIPSSTDGPTGADGNPSSSKSTIPAGVIVGGVLGGVAVISITLVILILIKRQRLRRMRYYTADSINNVRNVDRHLYPEPYLVPLSTPSSLGTLKSSRDYSSGYPAESSNPLSGLEKRRLMQVIPVGNTGEITNSEPNSSEEIIPSLRGFDIRDTRAASGAGDRTQLQQQINELREHIAELAQVGGHELQERPPSYS